MPSEPITSLQNPQIKRLVRLKTRREREQEGVWLVEGARELSRAVAALGPGALRQVFVCEALYSGEAAELMGGGLTGSGLMGAGAPGEAEVIALSRPAFEKVSHRENPDGVLALVTPPALSLPEPGGSALVLVLVGLEKPGNIGALLRTADGAGVDAVLLAGGTDPGNPNVIRASQGSVFTQPVIPLGEGEALAWLDARGFTRVACTPEAAVPYWDAPLTGRVALCLGSEHHGLPDGWRDAPLQVGIPMRGAADSLNVATAGALVLYEALRQRQQHGRSALMRGPA